MLSSRPHFLAKPSTNAAFRRYPCGSARFGGSGVSSQSRSEGPCAGGEPPRQIVMGVWRRYLPEGDSKAYVFCCLDRLRSALRRRDLFVQPSFRYGDARIGLLHGQAWEAARPTICRSLGHSLSAEETLIGLGRQLSHVYHQVAANQLARVESRAAAAQR